MSKLPVWFIADQDAQSLRPWANWLGAVAVPVKAFLAELHVLGQIECGPIVGKIGRGAPSIQEGGIVTERRTHDDGQASAGEGPGEALRFEGFSLDLAGHELSDGSGKEVALTPAEFGLLAAFVRGAGPALSRDHLLQAVAGRDTEAFDRSIDKIEPDPKMRRLIVTVPGVGYKFAVRPVAGRMSLLWAGRSYGGIIITGALARIHPKASGRGKVREERTSESY